MEQTSAVQPSLLRLLFGFSESVSRRQYLYAGLTLMVLKYGVEASVLGAFTGEFFSPADFLSPFYTRRMEILALGPQGLSLAYVLWTLPFLWVANSMSTRRAADAGWNPWFGLGVLVPLFNYLVMGLLCCVPSSHPVALQDAMPIRRRAENHPAMFDLLAVLFGPMFTLAMVGVSVLWLNEYGFVLFLLSPTLIGAVSAYLAMQGRPAAPGRAFSLAILSMVASGGTLLVFALEGAICLLLVAPLALGAGMFGAAIGIGIATMRRSAHHSGPLSVALALPILAVGESELPQPPLRQVTTTVVVDAPPEAVWRQVIAFPRLTEQPEWYFRAGIASPIGATIDGTGVGAVRRCRFTTGEFVEPITVWDAPRRLAFDVASQPHPMAEVNPFGDPHPPHLDSALRSECGEFLLEPLPGSRTRLTGTTWYRLHMRPLEYWSLWSDAIIHRIHARVLRHVARLSEV